LGSKASIFAAESESLDEFIEIQRIVTFRHAFREVKKSPTIKIISRESEPQTKRNKMKAMHIIAHQ